LWLAPVCAGSVSVVIIFGYLSMAVCLPTISGWFRRITVLTFLVASQAKALVVVKRLGWAYSFDDLLVQPVLIEYLLECLSRLPMRNRLLVFEVQWTCTIYHFSLYLIAHISKWKILCLFNFNST
jgi:hypothetical protein